MKHPKAAILVATLGAAAFALPAISQLPRQQPAQRFVRAVPFISVVEFGASGADDRWDSDAIQRAIDSLPKPSIPGTKEPAGGVVVLPAGRYTLNKPIQLFNGVTLRGEGPGTVLYAATDQPAILLVSPFTHTYLASASVEDLCIYTDKSPGILVDPSVTNLVQCRFENLLISAAGCAIDLNPKLAQKCYTQNTVIRNIHISKFGGPALRLWGNANHIEQINTEGGTRPNFTADPAIITISGGANDIRACVIEGNKPAPAVAFHISGSFTWSHNWVELDGAKDNIAYVFKDIEFGQIDFLHHILPWHKAKFVNCVSMQIRMLDLDGELAPLSANIELDDKSSIRIDQIIARADAGMLDDPRVSIGSVINKTGGFRVDTPSAARRLGEGVNLIANAALQDTRDWEVKWESGSAPIRGESAIERNAQDTGNRLRIEVKENLQKLPLAIDVKLRVPESLSGSACIAQWRVDGPGQVLTYFGDKQVPSRAMNSLTANLLPAPVTQDSSLRFVLPPEPGVYYISDVAVYPR